MNGDPLVDEEASEGSESRDDVGGDAVEGAGGGDPDGAARGSLDPHPFLADEGDRVAVGFGSVEALDDVEEELVGELGVDQIGAFHCLVLDLGVGIFGERLGTMRSREREDRDVLFCARMWHVMSILLARVYVG